MESSGDSEFMGHFKFSSPGAKKRRSGAGYVTPSASSGGSLSSGDTEPVVGVDIKYSAKLLEGFLDTSSSSGRRPSRPHLEFV